MNKIIGLLENINPFNRSFYVINNDHFLLALSAFFWTITTVIAFFWVVLSISSLFVLIKAFAFSFTFSIGIRAYDTVMFMLKKRKS